MTARHSALKLSELIETPVRSAVADLHGCRVLRSSSWNVRRYELAGSQSAYLLRQKEQWTPMPEGSKVVCVLIRLLDMEREPDAMLPEQ
jgi:hypothetical protein